MAVRYYKKTISTNYAEKVISLNQAYIPAVKRNDTIKANKDGFYQSTLLKLSAISLLLASMF